MHPLDIADLVAESFEHLDARIEGIDEGIVSSELERDFHIYLTLTHTAHKVATETLPTGILVPGGAMSRKHSVPVLGTRLERTVVLHADAERYNMEPAKVELLNELREPMPLELWPAGLERGGIVREHPTLDRPFFCRPGTYGYHTHPAHQDNPWAKHREGLSLNELLVGIAVDLRNEYIRRR